MSSKIEQGAGTQLLGARLREERERQRLRVEDIASLATIPVHAVRAIEENRFDDLLSPAHAWQFVNSYARALDCDPGPWLDQLLELMPHARSTRILRRGRDLMDDRRVVLRQRLVATAVVAVLWLLYTFILNMVTGPRDRGVRTGGDISSIEETLGAAPTALDPAAQ